MPTPQPTKKEYEDALSRVKPNMSFSDLVKLYRLQRRMSQSKLARTAGFDHSYASKLESGGRNPTREMVIRIAEALGFTEKDSQYDSLLDAAGYKTIESTVHFATEDFHQLDILYRSSMKKTQDDIDVAIRLLIEAIEGRNHKATESRTFRGWPGVL